METCLANENGITVV